MSHQCSCGNAHNDVELGIQYSLYGKIDGINVECLNEYEEGTGVTVFKPWEERLNFNKFVESDVDDELLFNIPFVGNVKLKGLIVIGGEEDSHPNKVRLYKNRPHMTFDDLALKPEQEFELCKDRQGVHEYPLNGNDGGERTKIYYIGLKGEWTPGHHHGVTICTYESRPQISDHVRESDQQSREIS